MKKFALSALLVTSLFGDVVEIRDFESDLFSKYSDGVKKIEFSLLFDGRDLKENRHKIVDALNIVTSSFYIEELFTSKGKERFKKVIISYLTKKYAIDIDDIFIQKFKTKESVGVDQFIRALRREGFCREAPTSKIRDIGSKINSIDIDN